MKRSNLMINEKRKSLIWESKFFNKGEIGHGGNSKVYKVIKKSDKECKEIALKDPGKLNSVKVKRFLNEIKIVMQEQNACNGILPILECSEKQDGCYWYTMPIAKPIKDVLYNKSEEVIISAILQVAQTLKVLHSKNIYHRDIKPENMFFIMKHIVLVILVLFIIWKVKN